MNITDQLTHNNLASLLQKAQIPLDFWGKGEAKTVAHLLKEINDGETELVDEEGKIIRYVEIVGVNVFYRNESGDEFWLREEKQVFSDNRVRKRMMDHSVSEKMIKGETPEEAFRRALLEELPEIARAMGPEWVFNIEYTNQEHHNNQRMSASYPGLLTRYTKHFTDVLFGKEHFIEEGYQEVQDDKTTYFAWQKILPRIHE